MVWDSDATVCFWPGITIQQWLVYPLSYLEPCKITQQTGGGACVFHWSTQPFFCHFLVEVARKQKLVDMQQGDLRCIWSSPLDVTFVVFFQWFLLTNQLGVISFQCIIRHLGMILTTPVFRITPKFHEFLERKEKHLEKTLKFYSKPANLHLF